MRLLNRLFSPIFIKELRPLMRSGKAFAFLMIVLIIVGGVFLVAWGDAVRYIGTISGRTRLGREMFMILSLSQMCCFGLISPILTATAISGERERRTLDLLRITGIKSGSIIWGKLGSALAYQAVMVVCLLPIMTLVFMLGGVGLNEFVFWTFMILQVIIVYGMLGLAISSFCRKSTRAMVVTVLVVVMFSVVIPFLMIAICEFHLFGASPMRLLSSGMPTGSELIAFMPSPVLSGVMYIENMSKALRGGLPINGMTVDSRFLSHIIFQILLFMGSFSVARWGLERRESFQVKQAKEIIDDAQALEKRRNRFPYYMIDPLRRALPIGDRQNPVFIKEKRVGTLASSTALIRACYLMVFLSMWGCFSLAEFHLNDAQAVLSLGAFGLTVICLPILAGTIVSREREESTLDLLASTLVSPFQIVWAKFLVVMRFVLPLALSMLVLPLLFYAVLGPEAHIGNQSLGGWLSYAGATLGMGIRTAIFVTFLLSFYAAVAMYCSCRFRKSITAILMSILISASLIAIPCFLPDLITICFLAYHGGFDFLRGEISFDQLLDGRKISGPWSQLIIHVTTTVNLYMGSVISPICEFVFMDWDKRRFRGMGPNIYEWKWSIFHASTLFGMTYLVLQIAARRLRKSIR